MSEPNYIKKNDIEYISRDLKVKSFSIVTHQYFKLLGKLKPVADSCGQLGTFGYCDNLPYESYEDQKQILKMVQFRLQIPYEIKIMNLPGKNRFILYIEEYIKMLLFTNEEVVNNLNKHNIFTVQDLIKKYIDPSDCIGVNAPYLVPIMHLLWNDIDNQPELINNFPIYLKNAMNAYR